MMWLKYFRLWNKESRSGKLRGIVRKVVDKKKEEKQYIEASV